MTTKYFDNKTITIKYDSKMVHIYDGYNDFEFILDAKMKKYFVPYIERLYKICELFKRNHIPTHNFIKHAIECEVLCDRITNCYRKYGMFQGNYMDIKRKDKIISAFKECFKRVKEEDIELSDMNLEMFDIKTLLFVKKGLL